jgi:hypothetical protein
MRNPRRRAAKPQREGCAQAGVAPGRSGFPAIKRVMEMGRMLYFGWRRNQVGSLRACGPRTMQHESGSEALWSGQNLCTFFPANSEGMQAYMNRFVVTSGFSRSRME